MPDATRPAERTNKGHARPAQIATAMYIQIDRVHVFTLDTLYSHDTDAHDTLSAASGLWMGREAHVISVVVTDRHLPPEGALRILAVLPRSTLRAAILRGSSDAAAVFVAGTRGTVVAAAPETSKA